MNESIIRRVGLTKQTGKTDKRGKRIFYILMLVVFSGLLQRNYWGTAGKAVQCPRRIMCIRDKFYGKNRMGAVSRLLFRGSMMLQKMRQWCLLCSFRKVT